MRKAGACFSVCVGLLCLAIGGQAPAMAQLVFHDSFDGTSLDTSKWSLDLGTGNLVLANGEATLSCPTGQFPYLTTSVNPIPAVGGFIATMGLRYAAYTAYGVGVVALGVPGYAGLWVWGNSIAVGDSGLFAYPSGNTDPHVFQWTCVGNMYTLTVDGAFKGSAVGTVRPTGLGFGHPPNSFQGVWTTLVVDFVSVELLQPTATESATWGRLKSLYR